MEYQPHPTHHRPFALALRFATLLGLAVFIADLLILRDYNKAIVTTAAAFIGIVIVVLFWTLRHCRTAVCPNCHQRLPRDKNGPRGECHYRCEACQVVWVSEIRTMGA